MFLRPEESSFVHIENVSQFIALVKDELLNTLPVLFVGLRTVPYTATAVHMTAVLINSRTVCRPVCANPKARRDGTGQKTAVYGAVPYLRTPSNYL